MSLPDRVGEPLPPRQHGPRPRGLSSVVRPLMRFFFFLIYEPMAWSYDLVAWIVSLGRWKSWVLSVLPYLDGEPVLELGHGPGYLQIAMRGRGMHTFGLDISHQMGFLAKRNLANAGYSQRLVRGKSQVLPFPSSTFLTVVATFPSEYIFQPETLAEILRVLMPGGRLVIAPLAWITGNSLLERLARWLFRITGEAPEWNEQWLELFREAGFHANLPLFIERNGSRVLVLVFEVSDKLR